MQRFSRRRSACLRCRGKKARCTGKGFPCGTCTASGLGSTCEFPKTETHAEDTASPNHCNITTKSPRKDVLGPDQIQRPERSVREGCDIESISFTSTFAALDRSPAGHDKSLGAATISPQTSSLTAISELSESSSLGLSSFKNAVDSSSPKDRPSYEQLFDVLPGREMIDHLIKTYFASISTLFGIIDATAFGAEYTLFLRDRYSMDSSWLALLFAILALACRAEEDPTKGGFPDAASTWYEETAWKCLSANSSPSQSSPSTLKAMLLIIYGRTHRGENVLSQLRMAYRVAISTKSHFDTAQCVSNPSVCKEFRAISIGLETLFIINAQMHDYYRNPELRQELQLLLDTAIETSELTAVEVLSPMQMTFTNLYFQLLKISETICSTTELGWRSDWSVSGLETEISRMEDCCSKLYIESNGAVLQSMSPHPVFGILQCYINYVLHLLFLPDLENYLEGDIAVDTKLSAFKCIAFAKASLRTFNYLAENMQPNAYGWYIRGLGSYYAEQSAYSLARGAEELEGQEDAENCRSLVQRTLQIFSTLSGRSIFSARGASNLQHPLMPPGPQGYCSGVVT
ncbi:uncharacterized protein N7511_008347 [Penicillium nucicola]|uniref:uncharacterized protein n=1 Tax=Penicillium nucicola TaxID=1850975 RepID=UPI00254538C0|nr:uncharacterized protein N7511_008347 [Penicillium nucicola]KAJ5751382.1 hypothetical protein N7511_008347 [Penicillium nucicola]